MRRRCRWKRLWKAQRYSACALSAQRSREVICPLAANTVRKRRRGRGGRGLQCGRVFSWTVRRWLVRTWKGSASVSVRRVLNDVQYTLQEPCPWRILSHLNESDKFLYQTSRWPLNPSKQQSVAIGDCDVVGHLNVEPEKLQKAVSHENLKARRFPDEEKEKVYERNYAVVSGSPSTNEVLGVTISLTFTVTTLGSVSLNFSIHNNSWWRHLLFYLYLVIVHCRSIPVMTLRLVLNLAKALVSETTTTARVSLKQLTPGILYYKQV